MDHHQIIRDKFRVLEDRLDEAQLRLWLATEANALESGGVITVARATGVARSTIYSGLHELRSLSPTAKPKRGERRVRREGGGRKKLTEKYPTLLADLESLVSPDTRGDPMSPLKWTCKGTRRLALELAEMGYKVSQRKVCELLEELGYSLQATRKTREGGDHPDRDEQFKKINSLVIEYQSTQDPVISVDTKKKELVGDFWNAGREWQPAGKPEEVRVYDFVDKELGKVAPYGVYDVTANLGWVSVGIDHDTAEFAVESIRRWWREMGGPRYPNAKRLLITADCGGSNGYRLRLWKVQLQKLADELGITIAVSHFPPGTSKWNKIEHRMFCHITQNWRGRPLISYEVVVNLIANTTTVEGLRIQAQLDENKYAAGIKVSDQELAELAIRRDDFHGEWNYQILPRR